MASESIAYSVIRVLLLLPPPPPQHTHTHTLQIFPLSLFFFPGLDTVYFLLDMAALDNNNYTSSINILPQYLLQRNAVMDIIAA